MTTQTLKLGTHGTHRRVWLENLKFLNEAGFKPGVPYNAFYYPKSMSIKLELDPEGVRKVSKKTRAGREVPVIDLDSTKVGWALGNVERIKVKYNPGVITIKGEE